MRVLDCTAGPSTRSIGPWPVLPSLHPRGRRTAVVADGTGGAYRRDVGPACPPRCRPGHPQSRPRDPRLRGRHVRDSDVATRRAGPAEWEHRGRAIAGRVAFGRSVSASDIAACFWCRIAIAGLGDTDRVCAALAVEHDDGRQPERAPAHDHAEPRPDIAARREDARPGPADGSADGATHDRADDRADHRADPAADEHAEADCGGANNRPNRAPAADQHPETNTQARRKPRSPAVSAGQRWPAGPQQDLRPETSVRSEGRIKQRSRPHERSHPRCAVPGDPSRTVATGPATPVASSRASSSATLIARWSRIRKLVEDPKIIGASRPGGERSDSLNDHLPE
jgi:hypothetical protein